MQLLNAHVAETSEAAYRDTIYRKTARLFESAGKLGGIIANASAAHIQALGNYGKHLGNAFQIIDDLLDYQASSEHMGKNTGDDLAEGKPTLPLIEAMRLGNANEVLLIKTAIEKGDLTKLDVIVDIIEQTGAMKYSQQAAHKEAEIAISALSSLPESLEKSALIDLANFSVARTY